MLLSSFALGVNWIFIFQAYKHTTIANTSLSYYFAPVFVIVMSPIVLKEKISIKKALCISTALLGMFLIVQNRGNGGAEYNHLLGICCGITAAVFYATLMLCNKFIKNMNGLEITLLQLSLATIMLIPYVFATEGVNLLRITVLQIIGAVLLLGSTFIGETSTNYDRSSNEKNKNYIE